MRLPLTHNTSTRRFWKDFPRVLHVKRDVWSHASDIADLSSKRVLQFLSPSEIYFFTTSWILTHWMLRMSVYRISHKMLRFCLQLGLIFSRCSYSELLQKPNWNLQNVYYISHYTPSDYHAIMRCHVKMRTVSKCKLL